MAKTNYRGYLRTDQIPLKKYFYVLRPLLAIRWLERYQCAAPIEFSRLLHLIEDKSELLADILALLERKRAAPELGLASPIRCIDDFIRQELERLESFSPSLTPATQQHDVMAKLNDIFRHCLTQAWSVK